MLFCFVSCGKEKVVVPEKPKTVASEFSASPTCGPTPLKVQFSTPAVTSPTTYSWDFGDGSSPSQLASPQHTYDTSGGYTVSLSATNAGGTSRKEVPDLITSTPPTPLTPTIKNGTLDKCKNSLAFSWTSVDVPSPRFWRLIAT